MSDHPYDTFFDETQLSKAAPNLKNSIQKLQNSRKILQHCLESKKTRDAPSDLSEELFKFS